jgi:hypothetical protein
LRSIYTRKACVPRGFRAFWIGLQAPKIGNLGENLLKVSSPPAENSHFWETLSGDFFDWHCVVGPCSDFRFFAPVENVASLNEKAGPISAQGARQSGLNF